MTTIAWDGEWLAGDGRISTADGEIIGDYDQKVMLRGEYLFGFCGDRALREAVIAWFRDGTPSDGHPAIGDWDLITVNNKGAAEHFTQEAPYGTEVRAPFALGTGQRFALMAMKCGKNAQEAVSLTKDCDVFTGGSVTAIAISDIPKPMFTATFMHGDAKQVIS